MAGSRFFFFAILAAFGALNVLQNDFAAAIRVEPGLTVSPDMNESDRQSKRQSFSLRRLTGPIQRAMSSLRGLFTRQSRGQPIKDLGTIKETASKYIDCLNLGPSGDKAFKASAQICSKLGNEALERICSLFSVLIADALTATQECINCFNENRLFFVHPLLHESTSDETDDDNSDPHTWYSRLRFDPNPNKDLSPLAFDALTLAFHRVNQGVRFTVDTQYMVGSKMLFQSTIAKRGLRKRLSGLWRRIRRRGVHPEHVQRIPQADEVVDQGRELFEGLPPHPDPLSVRLAVFMLLDGVSCPADLSIKRYETVLLNGKPKKVNLQKVIEATVLLVIERLFSARDCITDESKVDETTCRLLRDYDQYRQSAGKQKPGYSHEPTELHQDFSRKGEEEVPVKPAQAAVNEQGGDLESLESDSGIGQALESINSGEESSQGNQAFAEMPSGDSTGKDNDGYKGYRMFRYAAAATENAVAMARIGMRSETVSFRVAQSLLNSKAFRSLAIKVLMRFAGEGIFSIDAMAALASYGRRGKLLFGVYFQSMVQLATGSIKLGKLSGSVVGAVAQEASQLAQTEDQQSTEQQPSEQHPASLLQESIPVNKLHGMLKAMGISVKKEKFRKIAGGVTIGVNVLLFFTIVTLGALASPLLFAVSTLAGLLLLFHSVIVLRQLLRLGIFRENESEEWEDTTNDGNSGAKPSAESEPLTL
ncbi:hypothetical protein Efla_004371 [Eimeria flavescens]